MLLVLQLWALLTAGAALLLLGLIVLQAAVALWRRTMAEQDWTQRPAAAARG